MLRQHYCGHQEGGDGLSWRVSWVGVGCVVRGKPYGCRLSRFARQTPCILFPALPRLHNPATRCGLEHM
jgi:hypothetical protein